MKKSRILLYSLSMLFAMALFTTQASAQCNCADASQMITLDLSDPANSPGLNCFPSLDFGQQQCRVFRDANESNCNAPAPANPDGVNEKACPGDFNCGTTFDYAAITLVNLGPTTEVPINFNTGTCGVAIHVSVFLGPYAAPTGAGEWCGNNTYLGDQGSSLPTVAFCVHVPVGQQYTVVFSSNFGPIPAGCTADFEVMGNAGDPSCLEPPAEPNRAELNPNAVPTMTEWGFFLFGLIILTMGIMFIFKTASSTVLAGTATNVSSDKSGFFPFNKTVFNKTFVFSLVLAVVGWVAIFFIWGSLTPADIIGMIIATPIIAYMLHLIAIFGDTKE